MATNIGSFSVGDLVSRLNIGKLVLPNFQRDFVWEPEDWQSLIASLMMEYPVGMLLIGVGGESDAYQMKSPLSIPTDELIDIYTKRLEEEDIEVPDGYEDDPEYLLMRADEGFRCDFLLDGQQRISAIDLVFGEAFTRCSGDELNYTKRFRWFLNLTELGIYTLEWPDLKHKSHSDVKDTIVKVPYRLGDEKEQDFYKYKDDLDLIADFCINNDIDSSTNENSVLLPLDEIYSIDRSKYKGDPNQVGDCFSADFDFADKLIDIHEEYIIERAAKKEGLIDENGEINSNDRNSLEKKLRDWRYDLRDLLKGIPEFEIPAVKVPAKDFERIAGIFSVINKTGVDLHVFDLLVAKTARHGETIRDSFTSAVDIFNNEVDDYVQALLSNKVLNGLSQENIDDYWNLSNFIGESSSISQEVNSGDKFPKNNRKVFAQVIALMSRIGDSIHKSDNMEIDDPWYEVDFRDIRDGADINLARFVNGVLKLGDEWKFGDDEILGTPKSKVWKYAEQAALQLLRAMLFCSARLGVDRYASLPYKQMLLVIACSLTDPVWEDITGETGRRHSRCQKLEKWYWSSIFGGAYQRRQDSRVCDDIPRVLSYLSHRGVTWSDVASADYDEEDIKYEESGIRGTTDSRFESVFDVSGYSDRESITNNANNSLVKAICSFEIRNGMYDFRDPDGEHKMLHTGIENINENIKLERDHIIPIGAWNARMEDDTNIDRQSQHPINSPINKTYISRESNSFWSDRNAFWKFEVFSENEEVPNELFSDHNLNEATLENEFRDHADLIRGGTSSDAQMVEYLLDPFLRVRFESLADSLRDLRHSVA